MDHVTDAALHRNLAARYGITAQRPRDQELCARDHGIAEPHGVLAKREEQLAKRSETSQPL